MPTDNNYENSINLQKASEFQHFKLNLTGHLTIDF